MLRTVTILNFSLDVERQIYKNTFYFFVQVWVILIFLLRLEQTIEVNGLQNRENQFEKEADTFFMLWSLLLQCDTLTQYRYHK